MALTPVQEAQVLDLIAQQSALLSLAGVEATILSKLGATKVTLSDLPTASVINDADLLLLRQGVTDKSVTGLTFKNLIPSTITTPPQFDNDTSIANTEFVQRALGNMQAMTGVAVNQTFLPADVGKHYYAASASPITWTLPLANSVRAGSKISVFNSAAGLVTITRQGGSDIINLGGTTPTSTVVAQGESIDLISDGANTWYSGVRTAQLGLLPSFLASLAASGYQKLPSGLIIQWGTTAAIAPGASATVAYPIAFPNAPAAATAMPGLTANTTNPNPAGIQLFGAPASNSKFIIRNTGITNSYQYTWVAIGY